MAVQRLQIFTRFGYPHDCILPIDVYRNHDELRECIQPPEFSKEKNPQHNTMFTLGILHNALKSRSSNDNQIST